MKKILTLLLPSMILFISMNACAQQDKSKRPSPPATATETLSGGAVVTIDYSQPSLKGRTIGKDVEPMKNELWRAGANEATTFYFSQDVMVEGKALPKGKYAFFVLDANDGVHLIFNKQWKTWGAFDYEKNKGDDALQVIVPLMTNDTSVEKLAYTIDKSSGKVALMWGTWKIEFTVQ